VAALVVQCAEGNYSTICKGTLFYLTNRITYSPSRVTAVFAGISVCRESGFAFLVYCTEVKSTFLLVLLLVFFSARGHT